MGMFRGTLSPALSLGGRGGCANRRGVSLRSAEAWLRNGFPLSEDLPLNDIEHFPREKHTAAGAVDDARPGARSAARWPVALSPGRRARNRF